MSCPNKQLLAKNCGILQSRMDQRGNHMKMNFKFRNECYKQVSVKKQMKKLGPFLQFLCSLPELCSLNYQKSFWQFCAELSKKSKSIKAIYIYASEGSRNALSENCIVYYTDLIFWRYQDLKSKNFVKFLLSQHLF